MALPVYLAMTAAEMEGCEAVPERIAWMACHFSSYGLGLSNIPRQLPEQSILILNDRIPVQGHRPDMVARQLADLAENFSVSGVLLDLQREADPQTEAIVRAVTEALPCPVAVTECYAHGLDCPVFLESPRAYHTLESRVRQWEGRELWLELSLSPGTVTVTKDGSHYTPTSEFPEDLPIHKNETLHCSYCVQESEQEAQFFFRRTHDDLLALLDEGEKLGITKAVGLYQELGTAFV